MNSLLISGHAPRAAFSVERSDRKIGGEVKITNQLSTDRQTVKLVEIFKGGSFEPTMDQGTEETLVFLNGSSIEIDGETKTATPNSLVRLTSGKAHKIFNDQVDKLSLYWIQARDKTAPALSGTGHQEPYLRKKEDCEEIKAKPDVELIYELYGQPQKHGGAQMHSVALVDIAKGGSSDEHFHPVVEETYMIAEGEGRLLIDSEVISVRAGDAKVIPVGKMHQIFNEGSETLKLVVVCVPFWTFDCGIYTKKET